MKKITLLFFLINFNSFFMKSQIMMTYRDVYDFNINDEFEFTAFNNTGPLANPNIQRYTIIAKRFSAANDTVFYKRHVTGYISTASYPTPTYTFYTPYNDSVYYTGLSDTLKVTYLDSNCSILQDTLYYSSAYCNALVYETYTCALCCFEPKTYDYIFGKGLGELKYEFTYAAYGVDYGNYLIYYKKDTVVCGFPDTITTQPLGIRQYANNNEQINIYPNPASNNFQVVLAGNNKQANINMYDVNGKLVLTQAINCSISIDASILTEGVYNINIISNDGVVNKRLVIVR